MITTDTTSAADEKPEPPGPYQTVWTMAKSPGVVSHHVINGDKNTYVDPYRVFFFFIIMFSLIPVRNPITPDLYGQMNNMPYSFVAKEMVEKTIKEQKTNLKAFTDVYDQRARNATLAVNFLMAFFFAFALRILNHNKSLSLGNHTTISYEFITLLLWCWYLVLSWFPETISKYLLVIISLVLLYAIQRNAYKQSVSRSIRKSALLVVLLLVVVVICRAIIFFFTISTY